MCRIGGRRRDRGVSSYGAVVEIPLFDVCCSNLAPSSGVGTVSGGQFDWGGLLPKGNGGVRRLANHGWTS
jgi:hypothetical protein